MSNKKAFDFARSSVYVADPIRDLCIIGGQNSEFKLPREEWGDLDTDDGDDHVLFDERVGEPLEPSFVANIDYKGVDVPILIAKMEVTLPDGSKRDAAVVVEGRKRVRAARAVNRLREKRGELPLTVECKIKRSTDVGLMESMIGANVQRFGESPETALAKLKRMMDRGVSIEQAALTFGKSPVTLKGWLDYDDNAIPAVKKAVDSGRLSQTAAASLVLKAGSAEKQQEALSALLASVPEGGKITRQKAKEAAKRTSKPQANSEALSGLRDQKRFLAFVENMGHASNTSEKTLSYWEGVEDALRLVTGSDEVGERIAKALERMREAEGK